MTAWTDPSLPPAEPQIPQLPPFSPHESTTEDGGTVDDTERSEPGVLADLVGVWSGTGLNLIWTPSHEAATGGKHFLQLAATSERQEYQLLEGAIPNRGLDQPDLFMAGARYTQDITSNGKSIHFESGVWLNVPATSVPPVGPTVARMASIPHGTTINAQGSVTIENQAVPSVPTVDITPFAIGNPSSLVRMPEQDLSVSSNFRTPDAPAQGFDQATLDDVNLFVRNQLNAPSATVTTISLTTEDTAALPGGGTANTAFLGPNALATRTTAVMWLLTPEGETRPTILAYTQNVSLDFDGLTWPHVTVGVLARAA